VAKLAKKKLDKREAKILKEYDSGNVTPADLAEKYGVHSTTMRRFLREHGRKLGRIAHSELLSSQVKTKLKRVLVDHNIKNVDALVSALDENFIIELREQVDSSFEIIQL
jgi:transposase-like protein